MRPKPQLKLSELQAESRFVAVLAAYVMAVVVKLIFHLEDLATALAAVGTGYSGITAMVLMFGTESESE